MVAPVSSPVGGALVGESGGMWSNHPPRDVRELWDFRSRPAMKDAIHCWDDAPQSLDPEWLVDEVGEHLNPRSWSLCCPQSRKPGERARHTACMTVRTVK